ncbi:hypothetical protein XOC_1194 [Xanthomonas oryzae pv. oryzicola BLS256]|uniref:Uncharacterized protein n=1 Tax=Xanthomonas oryzae pv. oryzicola (strain BLS256) TaxID=383407 RepID=G7TGI8_XANOB|nr:hypothetical protein XOC_1194 [Xanthomonas oryzae pv. oryzicola BLS256]QEO98739.1 hypothetical protein XOCgx_3750 [Xanthomonas oryzae pv. oryzicola]
MPQCGTINTIYTNIAKPVRQSFHHSRRRSNECNTRFPLCDACGSLD